jgi:hypothetical protein
MPELTEEALLKLIRENSRKEAEEVWHTHQEKSLTPASSTVPPATSVTPTGEPKDLEGHAFVPWAKKCLRGDCPSLNPNYKKPNLFCADCGSPVGTIPEAELPSAGEEREIDHPPCPR